MPTMNKTSKSDFLKDIENVDWLNKPSILLNPSKSEKTKKDLKILGFLLVGFFVFYLWWSDSMSTSLTQHQHELVKESLRPEMLALADAGKPSAILWMAANYPATEQHRLDGLIVQKNSEALLLKARLLYSTDKDASLKYLKAAALEGNPSAVKYLSEKKPYSDSNY